MTNRTCPMPGRTRAAIYAALAGACLPLAACDRNDQTSQAVKQAGREVHMIGGGGGPAATPQFERAQYNEAISTLTPVADRGLPEEQAAALVIMAQSQMGLAAEPAGAAASAERECLDRMTVIRSLLGDWLTANARAAALDEFDPGPALADIATSVEEKTKKIAEQQKTKAELDARIADLTSQAAQKASEAKAEEDQYAQLKQRAAGLRPTDAEPLVRQAAVHKKKSDELRNAGALLEARAAQIARQAAESQLLIDQFSNQKANFEATAQSFRQKLENSKKEAASARADAAKSAGAIDALVAELRTLRAGPLTEAADNALKNYRTAASTAGKAAQGDQNGGSKLTVGAAQQAIADLHWARAQGNAAYAQLLESLANAAPSLPKSAEYAKEATEVAAARKESLDAAKEAYESAQNAYGAVRARGDAKDRLDQLARSLEGLAKVASGDAKDLDAALKSLTPADAGAETPENTAAAGDTPPPAPAIPDGVPPELAAAVESFLAAARSGDQSATIELLYFAPGTENLRAPLAQIAGASARLESACRAKFGKGLAEVAGQMAGAQGGGMGGLGGPSLSPDQVASLTLADLQFTVSGDRASVVVPGSTQPLEFVNASGRWLLDPGLASNPQAAAMLPTLAGPMSRAFEELASEVEAGKYADVNALGPAMIQKITAAMTAGPGGG